MENGGKAIASSVTLDGKGTLLLCTNGLEANAFALVIHPLRHVKTSCPPRSPEHHLTEHLRSTQPNTYHASAILAFARRPQRNTRPNTAQNPTKVYSSAYVPGMADTRITRFSGGCEASAACASSLNPTSGSQSDWAGRRQTRAVAAEDRGKGVGE